MQDESLETVSDAGDRRVNFISLFPASDDFESFVILIFSRDNPVNELKLQFTSVTNRENIYIYIYNRELTAFRYRY